MPDRDNHDDVQETKGEETPELLSHPSYEELMQKLDEAEHKVNEHWERILRMQAENENVQRRVERDISNAHKYALEKFALELLPIVDSLELCVMTMTTNPEAEAILDGVKLTLKMFNSALEKFGIKEVNPLGKTFDPEYEQAISMQYDPKATPGTVLSVMQKGYLLNNRLLRPALVIVAKEQALDH